jgi:TonB-dependent receptor
MTTKKLFMGSASLTALLLGAATAHAQATAAPTSAEAGQAPANETAAPPRASSDTAPSGVAQEIVVTGIRGSLKAAETIKRNSDQIVDAIVAQDIGKFPDPTVASALQRIPGVQVTVGDNNEIQGPLIRGLADIETTLNGREVFTGSGRGFSFQDLPAEALAGAQVYKNNSANMIEGGVAGSINLDLHRPFDFKGFTVAGGVKNTLSTNLNKSYPSANLLISDKFDTGIGEIGFLISGAYSRTKFDRPVAFDDLMRSGNHGPTGAAGALMPTGTGGLDQFGTYSRPQLNASVQWQASPDLQFYGDALWAGYRNKSSTAFILNSAFDGSQITNLKTDNNCNDYAVNGAGYADVDGKGAPNPGATIEHLCNANSYTSINSLGFTSDQAHKQRTNDYIFGGGVKYDHDRLHVNLDVSDEKSTYYSKTFIIDVGKRIPTLNVTTNDGGGVNYDAPGNPLGDPSGFFFTNGLDDDRLKQTGKLFATKLDAKYEVGGILKEIQFGGRYARRTAQYQEVVVNPPAPGGPYVTPVDGQGLPADFLQPVPGVPRIDGGLPWVQPGIDYLLDPAVEDRLRSLFGVLPGDQPYDPNRSFDAKEQTYSGYVQAKYGIDFGGPIVLDGLAGVRITKTDRSIAGSGAEIVPDPTPDNPNRTKTIAVPVSRSTSDTDFLPNFSARLQLGGGLQLRASYGKVLSRPDFGSLNPGLNYALSTNPNIQNGGSSGNPDLKPQKADEYDATAEYYFGKSNYISVAFYLKNIKNRVITSADTETIGDIPYQISRPRNLGSAKLKGLEAGTQYFFDWLPGALSGVGAFANFTLADSKVTATTDPLYGEPLQGVSKYNYNIGFIYEKYGVSFRMVYNYRSHYYGGDNTTSVNLRPVDQGEFLDYVRAAGRLDFSLNYDVSPNLTLTADGTNITKTPYRSYYGNPLNPHDIRFDDTSYSLGVRFRF